MQAQHRTDLLANLSKNQDTVFDIGCGSGILSIASLLLGAKSADAINLRCCRY